MNNKEKLAYLAKIHNSLLEISVKGEDCILMADCIKALRTFIQSENINEESEEIKEE
jgi:hypothetical protein